MKHRPRFRETFPGKPLSFWRRTARRLAYRRMITIMVVCVLILLLSAILFNSLLVNRLSHEYGDITTGLHHVSILYGKMAFSTRVFDNIHAQLGTGEVLPPDRRENLQSAYVTHRTQYLESLSQLQTQLHHIHAIAHRWTETPLIRWLAVDATFDARVEALLEHTRNLESQARRLLPPAEAFGTLDASPLVSQQQILPPLIDTLHERNATHTVQSAGRALLHVNLVMSGLFLVVIVLAALLRRLLHHGVRYVETGLDLMNRYQFDPDRLPEVRPLFDEEWRISKQFQDVMAEQRLISGVKRETGRGYVLPDVLETLFEQMHPILDVHRIGVAFIDLEQRKVIAEHGILDQGVISLGPGFEADLDTSSLKGIMDSGEPAVTGDLLEELRQRPDSEQLQLLVDEGIRSNMILPLKVGGTVFAFLFISSRQPFRYTEADLDLGRRIADELSPLLDKTFLTQTIFSRITNSFADLVDRKDNETGDHLHRMVQYSVLIAEALRTHDDPAYRTTPHFVRDIANNAASHDIGKVAIPDSILKKPGRLTEEEWLVMKTHAAVGGDIFASLRGGLRLFQQQFYVIAENIARHHHERWDGSGYPAGLAGKAIPLEARITAVADVFDALTSKRVYKQAWTLEDAFAELERSAGSHLDPVLVSVFLTHREDAVQISRSRAVS
jgi:HD-GYP domain-containing protein (c-di-GMP phosphodiesterase class II)